jgi:hypothetical protein
VLKNISRHICNTSAAATFNTAAATMHANRGLLLLCELPST